jgi:hypothetical protein
MKRVLILSLCLLMIAGTAWAAKMDASKKATDVMKPIVDLGRPIFEGFEISVPPPGWFAIVNNPYTWEVGTYNPIEGVQNAVCYYDETYTGPQDEWIGFNYTIQPGDECLSFYSYASTYWAISPYQNYNLIVTINGVEVWNYYDDNNGAVTWAWQQYVVPLSAYGVGQNIEISFGYVGYDGAEGAFDAIQIGACPVIPEPCAIEVTCYFIDFNLGPDGWYSRPCGIGPIPWQWGVPVGIPTVACDGEPVTHVLATVLNGSYPVSRGEAAVVGPFQITAECSCLELCHYYYAEMGFDGGNVKVSTDGGATWQIVQPFGGYDDILDSTSYIAECVWGEEVFTGNSVTFVKDNFDLTDYIGQTVLVGFFFGADSSVTYPGWYIKWLKLGGEQFSPVQEKTWGSIKSLYR